ncbi:MAG: hypothetical protein IKJ00_00480 [Clostridia bacterium]|nr:hypothetical protein [Clostridia bacterium]
MKNSISKKALSAFLAIMMIFATMAGMFTFSASAAEAETTWAPAGADTWDKHYSLDWYGTTEMAADTNTVTIEGKHYKVFGYTKTNGEIIKEFIIDSEEDLAGLAVLTNTATSAKRQAPFFANCAFKITKDIDLSKNYWVPIAAKYNNSSSTPWAFGGRLIGAKNGADGSSITITGMKIDLNDTSYRMYAAGLVGVQIGGAIENITLSGATVDSTSPFGVGSFVGRQLGTNAVGGSTYDGATCTYTNLASDAKINKTSTNTDKHNAAGGIVGSLNDAANNNQDGKASTTFTNCTFTGTISNTGSASGGIVGYTETNPSLERFISCNVTSDSITAGTNSSTDDGVGGLAGFVLGGVYAEDCNVTVSSIKSNNAGIPAGGFIGSSFNYNLTLDGCSFIGKVEGVDGTIKGLAIGSKTQAPLLTITECIINSTENAINWIGSIEFATNATVTISSNTSSVLTKYYDGATSVPAIKDANETTIKDLGIQMSNDGTKMRVSAQILGKEYDKAGFEFYVTYTVGDVVKSSKINAKDVSTCYTSIKAGDKTIYADSEYYYIVFVIDGFDSATMSDISIGFAASVTKDATVTWSDSAYCDATVEVTQPG